MKLRKRKPIKVVSATSKGIVRHVNPSEFKESKVKKILNELGMDVREHAKQFAIRLDMQLLNKGLITI